MCVKIIPGFVLVSKTLIKSENGNRLFFLLFILVLFSRDSYVAENNLEEGHDHFVTVLSLNILSSLWFRFQYRLDG